MAKPNYSFQKRQKELAKQAKKEEKRLKKLQKADEPAVDEAEASTQASEPGQEG